MKATPLRILNPRMIGAALLAGGMIAASIVPVQAATPKRTLSECMTLAAQRGFGPSRDSATAEAKRKFVRDCQAGKVN